MDWVDSHCHLFMLEEDAGSVLDRAAAAGVGWVVVPGADASGSAAALLLADRFPDRVLAGAGLHPHEATSWPDQRDDIVAMAAQADAVGECGLDFYRDLSPRPVQEAVFLEHLALAEELDKPVIVHTRDAFAAVHAALESTGAGPRSIMHCWTAGPRWTRRFRDLGVTFSFAGPIAFATGDTVRRGAAEAPPERSMVETDTPYLTPPPHREQLNEPARIPDIGAALAEVWGMEVTEVARVTTATAGRVFGRG